MSFKWSCNISVNEIKSAIPNFFDKIFDKMCNPLQMQQYFKNGAHMRSDDLPFFMGYSANLKSSLGNSIDPKTGVLAVSGKSCKLFLPQAEKILVEGGIITKEQLDAPNPLLVINPGVCTINENGAVISNEFSKDMRQYIKFYENVLLTEGYFKAVDGIPRNEVSSSADDGAIYRTFYSGFGSLLRFEDSGLNGWRGMMFGADLNIKVNVLSVVDERI